MATRTNYVPNPSFETSLNLWTEYNASASTQSARTGVGLQGSASMRIDNTIVADYGRSTLVQLPAGTYTVSCYVRAVTAVANAVMVVRRKSDFNVHAEKHLLNAASGAETRLSQTFNLTAAAQVELLLGIGSYGAASAGSVIFDGVMIESSGTLGAYFDGSTADTAAVNYAWTGAANESTSTATDIDQSGGSTAGWDLTFEDQFNGTALGTRWGEPYNGDATDGGGVARNGTWSPSRVAVANGMLTISGLGDAAGGVALYPGQKHGRFEVRARFPNAKGYKPVLLAWPDERSGNELYYAPPTLVSPTHVYLTNTSTGRKTGVLDPNTDYIVHMPSTPITVDSGIEINGGRNVVLVGGEIHFNTDSTTTNVRRAVFIKGNAPGTNPPARTVHVEGLKMSGFLREGINIDGQWEQGLTVQLQNINCPDELLGTQATNHSDFVQVYNGPTRLRMDRAYAKCGYQALMLQPHQGDNTVPGLTANPDVYEFRNCFFEGTDASGALLYAVGGGRPTINTSKVFVRKAPSKAWPSQVLLEDPSYWGTGVAQSTADTTNPTTGNPGTGYVSPGYIPTAPDENAWNEGELDFMEGNGANATSINQFIHEIDNPSNNVYAGTVNLDASQWHTYAVEFLSNRVTYLVDGAVTANHTNPNGIPTVPMHLVIQLDIGKAGGTLGIPPRDGTTPQPYNLDVDYVRVYSPTSSTTSPPVSNPTPPSSTGTNPLLEAKCRQVWEGIKRRYIRADGGVRQREGDNKIVSEGQAYALMVAAQLEDWATFDLVEQFNVQVLERRNGPRPTIGPDLLAWDYRVDSYNSNPPNTVNDWNFATDADVDRYKALWWSWKRRGSTRDRDKALAIARQLKEFGFVEHNGRAIQITDEWQQTGAAGARVPGNHLHSGTAVVEINASYVDPSSYYLAKSGGDDVWWDKPIAGAWHLFTQITDNVAPLATTKGLFPDWNDYHFGSGQYDALTSGQRGWTYSRAIDQKYDGFRCLIRIVWTWDWYKDPAALPLINGALRTFLIAEWTSQGKIAAEYGHDGTRLLGGYENTAMTAGAVMWLEANHPNDATAAAIRTAKLDPEKQFATDAEGYKFWYNGAGGGNFSYFGDFWSQMFYMRDAGLWVNWGQVTAPTGGTTLEAYEDALVLTEFAELAVGSELEAYESEPVLDEFAQLVVEVLLEASEIVSDPSEFADLEVIGQETPVTPAPTVAAVAHRTRWQWESLATGEVFEFTGFVDDTEVLQGLQGWGAPNVKVRRIESPGKAGARTQSSKLDIREIAMPLYIGGGSRDGHEDLLRRLDRATNPLLGDGILRRISRRGAVSELTCKLVSGLGLDDGIGSPTSTKRTLIFQADDPYFYGETITTPFRGDARRGWFPILPLRLGGASVLGDVVIDAASDAEVWPIWTIVGPGAVPEAILKGSNRRWALGNAPALQAGEVAIVDTSEYVKTVTGPGGANWFRYLTARDLWPLDPGRNEVYLGMANATPASYIGLSYRPRTRLPA